MAHQLTASPPAGHIQIHSESFGAPQVDETDRNLMHIGTGEENLVDLSNR